MSVADSGRGVDWEAVRLRAHQAGLPAETREDLEQALFTSGLTTARALTTLSGRGVGLAAVRDEVQARGGRIEVESEPGRGTTFRFRFPPSAITLPLRPERRPVPESNAPPDLQPRASSSRDR